MTDLDNAREWAERWSEDDPLILADAKAAIKLIKSLPDQWVDVEKLRNWIDGMMVSDEPGGAQKLLDYIKRDFLTPPLPTLADMTPEERKACQWMQCKEAHFPTGGTGAQGIILSSNETSSLILERNGAAVTWNNGLVTPLPGEPKLELPGSAPDDVAYATGGALTTQDVVDECRDVRKERALPSPEDVPDPHPGEAWLVNTREGEQREALKAGNRWYVKDGDDVEEWVEEALTPISRLVPESHTLPEGMRLADHEEYGRVVVSPEADHDDDYKAFHSGSEEIAGATWKYVHKSELNFLGGDQHA